MFGAESATETTQPTMPIAPSTIAQNNSSMPVSSTRLIGCPWLRRRRRRSRLLIEFGALREIR